MNRKTNFKLIQQPCVHLHTLSIELEDGDELLLLVLLIPNIRCLHIVLGNTPDFDLLSWSQTLLPHLVEFHLYAECTLYWSMDDLITLLRIMPFVQRLVLHLSTTDKRLLDGKQIKVALTTANILYLDSFSYGVEYLGLESRFDYNFVINLQKTWLPQLVAYTFDTEFHILNLHTIPCVFRKFWI